MKHHFAIVALAVAAIVDGIAVPAMATGDAVGGRREIPLQTGWRFHFGDAPLATRNDFDDSGWEPVTVPHTWNAEDGTVPTYRRGAGTYRLKFVRPAVAGGERVYINFEGVCLLATVWLNGVQVGSHSNGFAAFRFDITELLRPGPQENVLVVVADTTWRDYLPPREGDFTLFGGVYRTVSLLVTPAIAIDPMDCAGPGVYLSTPEIAADKAIVVARVLIRNASDSAEHVTIRLALVDMSGAVVATGEMAQDAVPGESSASVRVTLLHPRRWDGRDDPYFYRAMASLEANGRAIDRVEQPLGIRTFRIDPALGFVLNEKPYDLHGVNLHQERAGKGWALSLADHDEDFALIAELGCTFVRLAHYQHDQRDYILADRMGLVLWTEHPLVNTVSADPRFTAACMTGLRELIRQNYNHPSVMFWGIGNEVQTNQPPAVTLLEALAREVTLEDPGRVSVLATNYGEPVGAYGVQAMAHNQYHGWYHDLPEDFAGWLDAQHAKTPDQAIGMSEYGAGAGLGIHRGAPVALDHSEEYQSRFHEVYWRTLRSRPWVWCKGIWDMFDFASARRDEGEQPGINDKGLVSRDRRTRKDAFYWYQANWTSKPMVYITSRRYSARTSPTTDIKIYSNCEMVELSVNGESRGIHGVEDHVALWTGVALKRGENTIVATACHHGVAGTRDTCTWIYVPPP